VGMSQRSAMDGVDIGTRGQRRCDLVGKSLHRFWEAACVLATGSVVR
jgi:hypothetical protein